jgi:uncharacterized glyoxalase superfamily protein PhnB
MLIDCELMGTERKFELPVADVEQAWSFYRDVMGAHELFRHESGVDGPARIGFTIGKTGFMITLRGAAKVDDSRPTLALLAAEFGAPFAAVVLHVEDPTSAVQRALEAGGQFQPQAASTVPSYWGHALDVIVDPFGHFWAFAKSSEGRPR